MSWSARSRPLGLTAIYNDKLHWYPSHFQYLFVIKGLHARFAIKPLDYLFSCLHITVHNCYTGIVCMQGTTTGDLALLVIHSPMMQSGFFSMVGLTTYNRFPLAVRLI